jgi:hypothetical protein
LTANADLLRRLVKESDDEKIHEANRALQNNLELEVLDWLPTKLLHDPRTVQMLMELSAMLETALAEWREEVPERMEGPQMDPAEVREEAENLDLPTKIRQRILP